MKQLLEALNKQLVELQKQSNFEQEGFPLSSQLTHCDRVYFSESDGYYDLIWFAGDYGYTSCSVDELSQFNPEHIVNTDENIYDYAPLSWFIDILIDNPDKVRSLHFTNDDVGTNGVRDWRFTRLLHADIKFKNLVSFKVQGYQRGDHNFPVVTENEFFEVDDTVSQLLQKMPNVYEVEVPSPPDEAFFEMKFPQLKRLTVQSNLRNNDFIKNLAQSPLLSQLVSLDFMDVLHDDDLSYKSQADLQYQEEQKNQANKVKNYADPMELARQEYLKELEEEGLSEDEIRYELFISGYLPLHKEEAIELIKKHSVATEYETAEEVFEDTMAELEESNFWDGEGNYCYEVETFDELDFTGTEPTKRTPYTDYQAFFTSKYIPQRFHFKLREYYLTKDQLFALQNLNKAIQFLHIPTLEDYYVNHRMEDERLK